MIGGCDVIIVNYNAGGLLKEAVASVLKMPAINVIVIDNASSDESLSKLAELNETENLELIKNKQNVGFAAACNQGINASTASRLFFLNPDARIDSTSYQRLVEVLDSDPKNGMVGGQLLNEDGTEQGGGRRAMITPWRSLVRATGLYHLARWWPNIFFDFYLHKQVLPKEPISVDAISGACMLVSRDAINKVGLWDDDYFLHVEDLDWCQRFCLAGYRILFVPDAPVMHKQGSCSKSRPIRVEWHKHHGMLRFYRKFLRKNYPGFLMWLVTFGVWLRFAMVASVLTAKRLLRVFNTND